jgi:hypothetical protein
MDRDRQRPGQAVLTRLPGTDAQYEQAVKLLEEEAGHVDKAMLCWTEGLGVEPLLILGDLGDELTLATLKRIYGARFFEKMAAKAGSRTWRCAQFLPLPCRGLEPLLVLAHEDLVCDEETTLEIAAPVAPGHVRVLVLSGGQPRLCADLIPFPD